MQGYRRKATRMFDQIKPIRQAKFPDLKPIGTQSVPKKQSLKEWAMAGGGIPASHKGRADVWHKKAKNYAAGGEVFNSVPDMADGGNIIPGPAYAKGGKVKKDPLDEFVPPRYRSAGRRPAGQDDRAASANMPVDFARGAISGALGAPGDIESLIRMLPGLDEKTMLPTSEDIEKRLPFRSDTPQGRAAAGLGTLAGGFYTGPGAPIRGVGKAAKLAGEGLGALKGSEAGTRGMAGQRGVVKMPGGNWLSGRVEKDLADLKRPDRATGSRKDPKESMAEMRATYTPEALATMSPETKAHVAVAMQDLERKIAMNNWVDSNLSNYVKKQMGTPDDPVRALAEQGITHKQNLLREDTAYTDATMKAQRKAAGFPEEGMAQSPLAKAWERASDESIASHRAGDIQEMPGKAAKREDAESKMIAARDELDRKFMEHIKKAGLSDKEVASLVSGYPYPEKAKMVGDTAFQQANADYRLHHSPMMESYMQLGRDNPWISKVDPDASVYAPYTGDLGFDHIMDVLRQDLTAGRIRPEQMNKISISDAVRRTHQFDEDMAKKMREAQIKQTEGMPVHKEYPEGYKWIELQAKDPAAFEESIKHLESNPSEWKKATEQFRVDRQKQLEDALKYEGDTMGHCVGGYCPDVMEGRSRIFSLRSAKGEPHVTIETQPHGAHNQDAIFKKLIDKLGRDPTMDEFQSAVAEVPPRIVQIKGKQNRAPKEEYLPYVQDFVKGGKWADVGDMENTGLRQSRDVFGPTELETLKGRGREVGEYLSPSEIEDLQRSFGSSEGMAHGGEAHMAGGGAAIKAALSKLGKFATESDLKAIKEAGRATHEQEAWIRKAKNADVEEKLKSMPARSKAANIEMGMYHPVGGGTKLSKPFEALHSTRVKNPKVGTPEVKILTPEDFYRERAAFYPLVGDKADTGTFLTHIGEKELEVPVGLGGGPRYMDVNYNPENLAQSAAWESGTGRTSALGKQAGRAGEGDRPVYGMYTAGSGTNTDFNIMGTNAALQQIPHSKITKKTEKAFDAEMRSIYPEWPGLKSEAAPDLLMDKSQGELRKSFLNLMGSEPYQKAGLPDVPATRKAIMDPQLLDTPTHEAGFRIARMDPTGRIIEDPLHPSDYPTAMAGELAGQMNRGVDYKDMFSTHFANRRLLGQPESGDYYSFSRAHPIQYADQEWLDKIMKAQEAQDKLIKTGNYAKGGKVKPEGGLSAATKSCSCHD